MGSMEEARRAGSRQAVVAVPASSKMTPAMSRGSPDASSIQFDNTRDRA